MEVRGPQGPNKPQQQQPVRGPLGKQAEGITGKQALKNAEKAFDAVSMNPQSAEAAASSAALSGETVTLSLDQMNQPAVKQQIVTLFEQLKSKFLSVRPAPGSVTPDAFKPLHTVTPAPAETPRELFQALPANVPKEVRQAFAKLNDLFWQKTTEKHTLHAVQHTQWHAVADSHDGKRAFERAKPHLLTIMKWVGPHPPVTMTWPLPKNTQQSSQPAGNQPQTRDPVTVALPSQAIKGFQDAAGSLFDKMAGAPIEELVMLMFMMINKDAETDLYDQLKKMDDIMKVKNAMRANIRAAKDAQEKLKAKAHDMYEQEVREGTIDRDKVSEDEYFAQCQITMYPPTVDDKTHDSSFSEPTIYPPAHIPDEWMPDAPGGGGRTLAQPMITQNAPDGRRGLAGSDVNVSFASGDTKGVHELKREGFGAKDGVHVVADHRGDAVESFKKDGEAAGNATGGMQVHKSGSLANIGFADGRPSRPQKPQPGAELKNGAKAMNSEQYNNLIEDLEGQLESLSGQSEMEQVQMQMYMDRRKNALEMMTNLEKQNAEIHGAINKNIGG